MLKLENHLGTTTITGQYFADLIGNCVSDCYGVVGIAAKTPVQLPPATNKSASCDTLIFLEGSVIYITTSGFY